MLSFDDGLTFYSAAFPPPPDMPEPPAGTSTPPAQPWMFVYEAGTLWAYVDFTSDYFYSAPCLSLMTFVSHH